MGPLASFFFIACFDIKRVLCFFRVGLAERKPISEKGVFFLWEG